MGIQLVCDRIVLPVLGADHDLGRLPVILYGRAFAEKFWVETEIHLFADGQTRSRLEDREYDISRGSREHGGPKDDRERRGPAPQRASDIGHHRADVVELDASVVTAGCSHTDQSGIRLLHCHDGVVCGQQPSRGDARGDQFVESRLADRAPAGVEDLDLLPVGVDTDDVMAVLGEAGSRDRPHIPESENCQLHFVNESSELEHAGDVSRWPQK